MIESAYKIGRFEWHGGDYLYGITEVHFYLKLGYMVYVKGIVVGGSMVRPKIKICINVQLGSYMCGPPTPERS